MMIRRVSTAIVVVGWLTNMAGLGTDNAAIPRPITQPRIELTGRRSSCQIPSISPEKEKREAREGWATAAECGLETWPLRPTSS
jgi:hypothetical protein